MKTFQNKKIKNQKKTFGKCGECSILQWNTDFHNLDVNGKPIHGWCKVKNENRIRSWEGCEYGIFQEKTEADN
jgi:hypothetical protein